MTFAFYIFLLVAGFAAIATLWAVCTGWIIKTFLPNDGGPGSVFVAFIMIGVFLGIGALIEQAL